METFVKFRLIIFNELSLCKEVCFPFLYTGFFLIKYFVFFPSYTAYLSNKLSLFWNEFNVYEVLPVCMRTYKIVSFLPLRRIYS